MAAETGTEQLLQRLFEQVNEHVETRWEYFTLNLAEKLSSMAAKVAGAFMVFVFAVLVLFFFSFGFAWWLGDIIGNRSGGFALAGLVFIPIAFFANRWVRPFVREKIIESFLHENESENPTDNG